MSDLGDALKAFAIDTWYKAFGVVGAIAFVVALFVEMKGLNNGQVQLIGAGAFLFGLVGQWKNETTETAIKPPNAYTGPAAIMTRTVRRATFLGVILEVVGVLLMVIGVWKILIQD